LRPHCNTSSHNFFSPPLLSLAAAAVASSLTSAASPPPGHRRLPVVRAPPPPRRKVAVSLPTDAVSLPAGAPPFLTVVVAASLDPRAVSYVKLVVGSHPLSADAPSSRELPRLPGGHRLPCPLLSSTSAPLPSPPGEFPCRPRPSPHCQSTLSSSATCYSLSCPSPRSDSALA
ncbi:hypothetical protein EJB05_50685, partial [Eragrostis curvula]